MKFFEKFQFGQNLRKMSIFFENFEKFRFRVKFAYKFFLKISVLVIFTKNFDLGLNLRIISILVKFSKKFGFWSKLTKNFDLFENSEKFRFGQIYGNF